MAFFELRQYRMRPGQRDAWLKIMEEEIVPFQVSKGMVISGMFVGEEDKDLFVWLRRFESEEERERLYEAVYQSETWKTKFNDRVGELIDREQIRVTRIEATPRSVLR
jgi:NIPSNAP